MNLTGRYLFHSHFSLYIIYFLGGMMVMNDEKKTIDGIEVKPGEEITEETIKNLSNNKGDDD